MHCVIKKSVHFWRHFTAVFVRRAMFPSSVNFKNVIDLFAGVAGMVFDQLEGVVTGQEDLFEQEIEPDDLTEISGIGRAFAQRLNESGILTYQQLGDLTADEVREITGAAQWQGDPAEGIADAGELAQS
jgi:hypothetical protein